MPGASGGPHGHGVDRPGASALSIRRFFVAAGNGGESGVQSRYRFNTIVVSGGRRGGLLEICSQSSRRITKRSQTGYAPVVPAVLRKRSNRNRRRVAKFRVNDRLISFPFISIARVSKRLAK